MPQYSLYLSEWQESPRKAPSSTAIFAVGDIHGRLDLLRAMQQAIKQQMTISTTLTKTIVYLGDYIDRGPASLGVLQTLAQGLGGANVSEHCLLGNHDQGILQILQMDHPNKELLLFWFEYGGKATLERLGVPWSDGIDSIEAFQDFQTRLAEVLGADVVQFLECLKTFYQVDEYVFVHAGIDPTGNASLEQQDFADLLLMREPFLSWPGQWPFPYCVVHGHTPARPTVCTHRVGVDTGAFYTDTLTTGQFEGQRVRFVTVSTRRNTDWRVM